MNKSESIGNLAAAVIAVMKEVKGVEKNTQVGNGSYGYKGVSDQDVKKIIGDAMAAKGLCLLPTEVNAKAEVTRWQSGTQDKQSVFTEVTTKYLLIHESGEYMEVAGYGHGADAQDKGAGKATTYALKYFLLYAFLVPTGKIDDADATHSNDLPAPPKHVSPFKRKYETVAEITDVLEQANDVKDIANLYYVNAELVESRADLKNAFTTKKQAFYNSGTNPLPE